MSFLSIFGMVTYQLQIGLTAYVFRSLLVKGVHKEFPCFTGYIGFCLLRSLLLFPLAFTGRQTLYASVWIGGRALGMVLIVALCAELLEKVYKRGIVNLATPVSVLPAGLLLTNFSFPLSRAVAYSITAVLLALLPKWKELDTRQVGIALGVVTFCVIPEFISWRFGTTLCWILALGVWQYSFREAEI
jgi:hypothetical protein